MAGFSQNRYNSTGPLGSNPLARIAGMLVGLAVLAFSIFIGALFFAAVLGLLLIGSVIFTVRMWWLRRKMEQYAKEHGDLEGEFTVVREDEKRIDKE